jgi:hypothetical protein
LKILGYGGAGGDSRSGCLSELAVTFGNRALAGSPPELSDQFQQWRLPSVICLRRTELAAVCLRHIASGLDLSLAAAELSPAAAGRGGSSAPPGAVSGYTQWGATWREQEILVRWNWGRSQDLIFVLNPAAIRANILLLDETDDAESFLLSRAQLLEWIESFDWREPVCELIARSAQAPSCKM